MKYELVIFDLDGTLLDTLDDLTAAVNYALGQHGFPLRERETVRRLIGNGIANTVRGAVPDGTPDSVREQALADFRAYYTGHLSVHTRPFGGIVELLDALKSARIKVAVNSNKVDDAVQTLCVRHLENRMDMIVGERVGVPRKPAPDGANAIIRQLGADCERTLYVGDGEADILTARNAGIDCAWAAWGYRHAEELAGLEIPYRFDDPHALGKYILCEE